MEKLDGTAETRDLIVSKVLEKLRGEPVDKILDGYIGNSHSSRLGVGDREIFCRTKSVSVEQLIMVLQSEDALPYLKSVSMRITNFIEPNDRLDCLLRHDQWPMTTGNAFSAFIARTFNIMFSAEFFKDCKTVKDLADGINTMCRIQH